LAAVLALAGCSDSFSPRDESSPLPTSDFPAATRLLATTEYPVIALARSTVLHATAVETDGSQRSLGAEWKALDGGSIRDSLIGDSAVTVFSAEAPGTYRLVGSSTSLSQSDTTSVIVPSVAQTSSIEQLVMSPERPTLRTNDTLRYTVHGLTAAGAQVPAALLLYPDRGYVRGLKYITPITGTFRVRAILAGTSLSDSSFVTVTTTAPLQPPAGSPEPEPEPEEPSGPDAPLPPVQSG